MLFANQIDVDNDTQSEQTKSFGKDPVDPDKKDDDQDTTGFYQSFLLFIPTILMSLGYTLMYF